MEKREGVALEEAKKKIFMRDSRGLIVKGRSSGGISKHKEVFAQEHSEMKDLGEIVKAVKPTILIGAAGQPNVFTEEIVKDMCSFTENPSSLRFQIQLQRRSAPQNRRTHSPRGKQSLRLDLLSLSLRDLEKGLNLVKPTMPTSSRVLPSV